MPTRRDEAVDREARAMFESFEQQRIAGATKATYVLRSHDSRFTADVLARYQQLLAGDGLPVSHLNPDD